MDCDFCVVAKKEGLCSHKVADLSQFWRGQKNIKLLDPNILACKEREDLIKQLIKSKAKIDYKKLKGCKYYTPLFFVYYLNYRHSYQKHPY